MRRRRRPVRDPASIDRALSELGGPREVLQRHGIEVRSRVVRCPFHADSDPSLSLFVGSDGKERWKCHGCGRGGDALDLECLLSDRTLREVLAEWGRGD